MSYGETDGGLWTAFHREEEYKKGTASSSEDHRLIDITRHEIDGAIKGTHLAATDRITFRNLVAGTRVVPFELFGPLRVTRVQDAEGKDLNFVQEDKDEDSDFGVICRSRSRPDKRINSSFNTTALMRCATQAAETSS